ncbi:MAG: YitT family protein [Acetatifactor sp.]
MHNELEKQRRLRFRQLKQWKRLALEYLLITVAILLLVVGVYFFKFPNHFSFGGVTGVAVVLEALLSHSAATYTFIINMVLLVFGFLFLGKDFGLKTVYASVLTSVGLWAMELWFPMAAPLTEQPVLELIFAIFLPALSSAILFNIGASGGGTDILAMILKKYTTFSISAALFLVDFVIVLASCFVFDIQTGLFSLTGLLAKSLVIDNVIESINLCKAFMIVCDEPEPICRYICDELGRSATIYRAEGAYSHHKKTMILTVTKRGQAVQLRNFVRRNQPESFITIFNSSEIIGKGFRGLN